MLSRLRSTAVLISAFFIFLLGAVAACVVVNATTYHTVRINYLFADGTHAHDPYIATFTDGEPVDVTVTNPTINGYDPMTLNGGETNPSLLPDNGMQAKTIEVKYDHFNSDVTYTVYYVAGLSHYRARFYLQNIYDDLYTTDQTLNAQFQDKLGTTGSFPNYLEEVEVTGFTSLFHEPDAIAADGSTVFRLYYDRNYYSVGFDLGEGGYGVEPIYAKYQTEFRVDEPKRVGYTFKGWARTDKDSSVEGVDWHYINENGEVISEETATADENLLTLEGDLTVPAKDTYYKAVWAPGTTSCSVVYWFENADSDLKNTAAEFEGLTEEEIQAKVSKNYSVIAAKDVFNVYEDGHEIPIKPGMVITPDTVIRNKAKKAKDEGIYSGTGGAVIPIKNFFDFNLGYANHNDPRNNDDLAFDENGDRKPEALVYKYDKNGVIIDFNDISQGTSEQLVGNANYFELNTADNTPVPNYRTDTSVTVRGDGTTRFNVYFRRKEFTLKFFYAREKLSDHTIELTNSTKNYSNKAYTGLNYMQAVSQGTWQAGVADSKPQLNTKYTDPESPDYLPYIFERYEDYSGYRYYYYQVEAKYNAPMKNKWLIDAIQGVDKKGFNGQVCLPGSWAVENATNYYNSHTKVNNYTIKGIYEKLGPELMFASRTADYTELHYLLSWTNSATSSGWNYGMQNVLHFTYQNYVELLPRELEQLEIADYDTSVLAGEGKPYIDVIQFTVNGTAKYYGLPEDNIIETTDSGSQYPINDVSKKTSSVRSDQTPTDLEGFEIENRRLNSNNQIILDTTNTIVDWSDDTTSYRHATIKFFYKRKEYTLKYRNGNRKDESHNRTIMYGAPLNAVYASGEHEGEHRYYWDKPNYFIPELQDHYMFDGWYYTPYYFRQVDVNTATMPAYDMTFYAKWVPKKIDVVFLQQL
ncbi:MAG: InlB B-repeat-containing protein [Ruminococcus sp.]|nr:InlB B-repeat-containing protein [Ruminococcus sp.]